jgi:hypothetical protein
MKGIIFAVVAECMPSEWNNQNSVRLETNRTFRNSKD